MRFAAILLAVASALSAGAQMPELPGFDFQTKPLFLLQRTEVVKELKLDGKQKGDLKKVVAAYNAEMKRMSDEAQKSSATAIASYGKLGPMTDEYGKQAVALLTPLQSKRLAQVRWQVLGNMALAEPDVQEAVGLDDDQKSLINDIAKDVPKNRMKIMMDNARDPKAMKKKLDGYSQDVDATLLKVLTPLQSDKYKAVLGDPFKDLKRVRG